VKKLNVVITPFISNCHFS